MVVLVVLYVKRFLKVWQTVNSLHNAAGQTKYLALPDETKFDFSFVCDIIAHASLPAEELDHAQHAHH